MTTSYFNSGRCRFNCFRPYQGTRFQNGPLFVLDTAIRLLTRDHILLEQSRLPYSTSRQRFCKRRINSPLLGKSGVPIPYNVTMNDESYMRMAIEEARRAARFGEIPIGAVVVYEPIDPATRKPLAEPRVISRAGNERERMHDPTGHAELVALRQASAALDSWRLTDCTVYVTLEPCIMCAGLMHQARIRRCVYGASDPKAGALGTLYSINEDKRLNHTFEATSGILANECADLLRSFFASKRKK